MAGITTYKGTVYPGHCDQMGHMNVLWYTARFDEASWSFLSLIGIHPGYLRDAGRRMAAAQQTISYMKELFAGDAIIVATSLDHIGATSLRITHEMYRDCDHDPVAVSELIAVHLDASTRRGCEFSAALRSKMCPFLRSASNASSAISTLDGAA
jgi:acyl-CoA thioester hydrolase